MTRYFVCLYANAPLSFRGGTQIRRHVINPLFCIFYSGKKFEDAYVSAYERGFFATYASFDSSIFRRREYMTVASATRRKFADTSTIAILVV